MIKVVIVGGGIIGCNLAYELAKYNLDITVLERGNDVSVGTTKANSGIVHSGFDAPKGSLKAKYNVLGNAMFDKLSKDLDFPFRRNGSMVLCFDENQKERLLELKARGEANGVPNIEIISGKKARELEPHISDKVVGAMIAKTGGIVSPYEMAIAMAENSAENGAKYEFLSKVVDIKHSENGFVCVCEDGKTYDADVVVNCAGVYADDINNMVSETKHKIIPRKGDYVLLDKAYGFLTDHTIFQMPSHLGKGVLVTPTTHGNILVGPTATDVDDKENVSTRQEELSTVIEKALLSMPELPQYGIITQFSGLRAHSLTEDFVVGETEVSGFYNALGIESPGLTAAPAIALDLATQIAEKYQLQKNTNHIGTRKAIQLFSTLTNTERQKLIDQNPLYGNVICRCEMVTEGEIVESIRRKVGARDLDGVKRRTRSGMGRCQMGFCKPKVMEILARELNIDISQVTKNGGKSNIIVGEKDD